MLNMPEWVTEKTDSASSQGYYRTIKNNEYYKITSFILTSCQANISNFY